MEVSSPAAVSGAERRDVLWSYLAQARSARTMVSSLGLRSLARVANRFLIRIWRRVPIPPIMDWDRASQDG